MIDHLPDPPQPGDTIPDFQRKAAAHVLSQRLWTDQANATADQVNDQAAAVAANVLLVDADALAAAGSKNDANNSRVQAGLYAGTATTKAGEASDSAALAATKRQESVDAAGVATQAKADTVQLKADTVLLKQAALDAATAAAASAAQAGAPLTGTSTDSRPIQAGALTINVGAGKGFVPGQYASVAYDATHGMRGPITAYNSTTGVLSLAVDDPNGAGTFAAWSVGLVGTKGAAGDYPLTIVTGTAVNAVQGNRYALTNTAATTVTMPSAPAWGGAGVQIVVCNGRDDNAIALNGQPHEGTTDSTMTIDDPFAGFSLVPVNSTYGWAIA